MARNNYSAALNTPPETVRVDRTNGARRPATS